mmetsp:Transcript_12610/g.36803  ORF Transcript_12610/g.36803 Transcript_12610/m.36803 type:complete len:231 (+) Transcript_12610:79-771(+)
MSTAAAAPASGGTCATWANCPHAQEQFRKRLSTSIPVIELLEIEEAGAANGSHCSGANPKLTIVSSSFEGLRPLMRQRLVHVGLHEELTSGAIHSLPDLQTLTPAQWRARKTRARLAWVEERLRSAIPALEHLEIVDVTNGHAIVGFHDGSRRALDPDGLELQLLVVSPSFDGMRLLERQRLVSEALGPELVSGAIHALPRMKAWTPAQWCAARARGDEPASTKRQKSAM